MEKLIQFRKTADALSKIEYHTFVLSLDRETLLSILFKHFHQNPISNYNIDELNKNLLSIIQKRDQKCGEVVLPTLDKIPITLINEISSYLDFQSHCQFEKVSRNTMIAARSPTQLQSISSYDLEKFRRYQSKLRSTINYDRFKHVKVLEWTSFSSEPDLPDNRFNNLILNNLNNVKIHTEYIKQFLILPQVCLKNITNIYLWVDMPFTKPIENGLINKMLQNPNNLKYLEVLNIHLVTLDAKTKLIFPKLTALSLNEFTDMQTGYIGESDANYGRLLNLCGSKLLSFHTTSELSQLNIDPKKLCNLTELCLTCISDPQSVQIISQFVKLKRITLDLGHKMWWNPERYSVPLEFSVDMVNKLFSLQYLESIDFSIEDKMITKLTRLIQNALMMYPKTKMKIYISMHADHKDLSPLKNMHFDLQLLVNSLNAMTEDFMLTISLASLQGELDNIQLWLNGLCDRKFWWLYDKYNVLHVANKNSKINGYSRKWITKCSHCKYY